MHRVRSLGSCLTLALVLACGADSGSDEGSAANQVTGDDAASDDDTATEGDGNSGDVDAEPSMDPLPGNAPGGSGSSGSAGSGNVTDPEDPNVTTPPRTTTDPPATEPDPAADPEPGAEPEPAPSNVDCSERPACDLLCPPNSVNPVDADGCLDTCACVEIPPEEPEPEAPEPEPVTLPCAQEVDCDAVCPDGTANPIDENGCVERCTCEPLPEPSVCGVSGAFCLPGVITTAIVAAPTACCEGYACVAQNCTDAEPPNCSYTCERLDSIDPCGGCDAGQACIFQIGGPGPSHYACAAEKAPCEEDDACGCILEQGDCMYSLDEAMCHCDNGLD